MRSKLRKCDNCGEYTLKEFCQRCGRRTSVPAPAKFSPEDPYGRYRRKMKFKGYRSDREWKF